MHIKTLSLINFRNYHKQTIELSENINLLIGDNAQGKTSVIEAISFLLVGKSRSSKDKSLINYAADKAYITCDLIKNESNTSVSVEISNTSTFYLNNNPHKIKGVYEDLEVFPVVFSPDDLELIKDGPEHRRNYIDSVMCLIWPKLKYIRLNFFRSLKNRNTLLKTRRHEKSLGKELDLWDEQLIKYGTKLVLFRQETIRYLNEVCHEILKKLSSENEKLSLSYCSTTYSFEQKENIEEAYRQALKENRAHDIETQATTAGPHRDDLTVEINGKSAREFCSQGQQRTLTIMLKIAQLELLKQHTNMKPILLLDDVLSELDTKRKNYLLGLINGDTQTIITSTDLAELDKFPIKARVFTVEKGTVYAENQ